MTKVLIFESDHAFAMELRSKLSALGCTVQVHSEGNPGLMAAHADRPHIILVSAELPKVNGFSICNKLKKDVTLREVPLILMSRDSTEETFEQHRKLPTRAQDYIHKPIGFPDLLLRMRRL